MNIAQDKADNYLRLVTDEWAGRRHVDGSICKAKSPETCPFEMKAENADRIQDDGDSFLNECESIRKKYEDTDSWLLAPNGNESNLDEEEWVVVRTPSFKKWFGDWENDQEYASKVVDENGEPLVVYHGSEDVTIETVDGNFWCAENWSTASCYTYGRTPLPYAEYHTVEDLDEKDWSTLYSMAATDLCIDEEFEYDGVPISDTLNLGGKGDRDNRPHGYYGIDVADVDNVIRRGEKFSEYVSNITDYTTPRGSLEQVDGIYYDDVGGEYRTHDGKPVDKNKFTRHFVVRFYGLGHEDDPVEINSPEDFRNVILKVVKSYVEENIDDLRGAYKGNKDMYRIAKKIRKMLIAEDPEQYLDGGTYAVFARAQNVLSLDCSGMVFDNIKLPEGISNKLGINKKYIETDDVAFAARDKGYDAVLFRNLTDASTIATPDPDNIWCFMNSSGNVKSVKNHGAFSSRGSLLN